MIDNANLNDLPIVEVPLELRGLSDEEILVLSESRVKEGFTRGFRPSKKERAKRRNEVSRKRLLEVEAQMQRESKGRNINYMAHKPMPKMSDYEIKSKEKSRFSDVDSFYDSSKKKSLADLFNTKQTEINETVKEKPEIVVRSSISSAPKPSSGRVLQKKFCFPGMKKAETTIVDAKDLEEKRAKERENKIKKATIAPKAPQITDGVPQKRPRGRPRKVQTPE